MGVELSNAVNMDLVTLFRDIRRSVEMKLRTNRELSEDIAPDPDSKDMDILFDGFRTTTTIVADKTSMYVTYLDENGNDIEEAYRLEQDESGATSVRERFMEQIPGDVEVFTIPGKSIDAKTSAYYQFAYKALMHGILSEWYLSLGLYEYARVEKELRDRYINNINNVSFRPTMVKAKSRPI